MSDERHERYCDAICGGAEYWEDVSLGDATARVMAVADEEQHRTRDTLRRAIEREMHVTAENSRLRDELGADVDGICTGMHADVAEAWSEIERLRADIERVRAVLDDHDDETADGWELVRSSRIRAALDGTS
ncbi:hypothetical protein OG436_29505 [Streptomyces caniferus]|uniref:hypothetical protein n=1 Tax=Streptomyces caniferus TaxID=285557 RepID=UPI002E28A8EE|nr:hypothetical protein [Streptomyces caniferus]